MIVPVTFTKCFYKENIIDALNNNSKFFKLTQENELFDVYEYFFPDNGQFNLSEKNNVYSKFLRAEIYVVEKSYIFICTQYETELGDTDTTSLGNTAFRISHNTNSVVLPDRVIIQEIFNSLGSTESILFIQPDGYSVKRHIFNSLEYDMFCSKKENDKSPVFSFLFYYLPICTELKSLSNDFLQGCKNAVFGNTATFKISSEINEIKISDCYSMFASNTGIGLFQTAEDYIKEDIRSILFHEYLKALKEIIHFEIKTKEFNRELDFGEYKNLDSLNKTVRKEMRNAVHLKYDIKNSVLTNSTKKIFYGKYFSAIKFDETLSEFIEICHSIENELHAKIDEREEEHDKHFDKILSVVAVFAIVSVFKDGSDLILSFLDAFQNCDFHQLKISEIVSLGAPVLCLIVLFILIKIFNKKK